MRVLHFRSVGKDPESFSLEVPADAIVSGVCDIIAEHQPVNRSTVRLMYRSRFLDPSTPISSLPSSSDDPIHYYGKRLADLPPRQSPPASPAPTPLPVRSGQQARVEEAIDILAALGFDRADCAKAIQLTPDVDLAANLILSGVITAEGLHALSAESGVGVDVQDDRVFQALLGSPKHFKQLQSGLNINVQWMTQASGVWFTVTPERMNSYLIEKYGVGLKEFQPDFGQMAQISRASGMVLQTSDASRPVMARIWERLYRTLMPHELAVVNGLIQEGFELSVVIRVFVGCDRNPAATRSTLQNMFTH
jgi:hypothetical protein